MRISDWSSDVCSSDLAHSFRPKYGAEPLQSLSTIFRRSRHRDHRSTAGPLPLIDVWFTGEPSRFLTDNFGTYHVSYGTGAYTPDAQAAARPLTTVNPDVRTDGRSGVQKDKSAERSCGK